MTDTFEATVCWFHDRPLVAGDRLQLKHTTRVTPVVVESVEGIFDVNDARACSDASELRENDIGVVRCARPPLWPSTPTRSIGSPGASS